MDASKKQREPVAFKSLAELKRFIRPGVEFKTVSHANHADMVGLTRVVTTVQTVGFYSKIKDQPEHPFSTCNHGKGFYTDFGKAGNYIFDGTTVKVKDTRKQDRGVIYELEFYDREQNMEEMCGRRSFPSPVRTRSGWAIPTLKTGRSSSTHLSPTSPRAIRSIRTAFVGTRLCLPAETEVHRP